MKLFFGAKAQHYIYMCVTNKQSIIMHLGHIAGYSLIVKITPKALVYGTIDCEN